MKRVRELKNAAVFIVAPGREVKIFSSLMEKSSREPPPTIRDYINKAEPQKPAIIFEITTD